MPKKILVAPLDWGLGHATRSIPVINEFLNQGCEVQIASSDDALVLLKQEFPVLKFHELVSYRAVYSERIPFMIKMLLQLPKFLMAIRKEHKQLEKIVEKEKINLVVSDNRYGCWSSHVPSVLITHQVNILMDFSWRWLEGIINYGNSKQIERFAECWVPDFQNGITGKMTSNSLLNVKFIGMISRFKKMDSVKKYDVLALISGPEPQRTLLELKIESQLSISSLEYFIVRGKPNKANDLNERSANHLSAQELNAVIESSSIVISRSGYTTIMDLFTLRKNAIFIPTPGQTEQEYLAKELMERKIIFSQSQSNFNLKEALIESKKYSGFEDDDRSNNLLAEAVKKIIS